MQSALESQLLLAQWEIEGHGEIRVGEAARKRAADALAAEREAENLCWMDSKLDELERAWHAASQMKLKLPKMEQRARVRDTIAHYLETVVLPNTWRRSECELPERLRDCRQQYIRGITPEGKIVMQWDRKASLPLLCPDDAREEGMRLSRRMTPQLVEAAMKGYDVQVCVISPPNIPAGSLAEGMRALMKKFSLLMRSCKKKSRPFPIVAAAAVMETPLSVHRDWNVHLNVILVCDRSISYKDWREWWGCQTEWRTPVADTKAAAAKQRKPLKDLREALDRSFREVLKYAVRAVPDKSQEKLEEGLTQAPSMIDWTATEWLEWWRAHKRFRRTRTFGRLYKLPKPEKLDRSLVRWVAIGKRVPWGWRERSALIDSIPCDNSTLENFREGIKKVARRCLGDPGDVQRAIRARSMALEAFRTLDLAAI